MSRSQLINLVARIMQTKGLSIYERKQLTASLQQAFGDPAIVDYLFRFRRTLTPEQVVEYVLAAQSSKRLTPSLN